MDNNLKLTNDQIKKYEVKYKGYNLIYLRSNLKEFINSSIEDKIYEEYLGDGWYIIAIINDNEFFEFFSWLKLYKFDQIEIITDLNKKMKTN
jgi:hypothetical protein